MLEPHETQDQQTGKMCCYDEVLLCWGSFTYSLQLLQNHWKNVVHYTKDFVGERFQKYMY